MKIALRLFFRSGSRLKQPEVHLAAACLLALFSASASGQAGAAPNPPAAPKAEAPSVQLTYEQRVRTEDWNNILDYSNATDDQRIQMRYKEHAWFTFKSAPVEFNAGLATEMIKKYALYPAQVQAYRLNTGEAIFEYLNVNLKKLPVHGLSLSVGRQEFTRGEGFLFLEGNSGDGSRVTYFNLANLTYQRAQSKFEVVGILNPGQERFLPVIHSQHTHLTEWDEQAAGLYYTDRNHKNSDVDAYYFYKKEIHDYRAPTHYQFQPNREVQTLGARLAQRLNGNLAITGEFAAQFGNQHANPAIAEPEKKIRAWGGYVYAKKSFSARWHPYVLVGETALSGDDAANTQTAGGFDPLFSRWPKWSELSLYSLASERGVGYWTNNNLVQIEGGLNPIKPLSLRATFYESRAFHPFGRNAAVFGTGTHRGENYQVRADYVFNSRWKAHALYEAYLPGGFYTKQDSSFFVQAQVVYRFNQTLFHFGKAK
jgi:hypothetical protein